MSEENTNAFSIKDLITIVPVAGIVLAAMYDWGFFNSVDASLFSLFSWGDHIVFALEALLPAIVIVSALGWSLSIYTFELPIEPTTASQVVVPGCSIRSVRNRGHRSQKL